MKNSCTSLILSAILLSAFTSVWAKAKQAPKMPPTVVSIAQVKVVPWQASFDTTGTLKSEHGVMLRPLVSGTVTKINFEPGQAVAEGTLLIELSSEVLKAQLEEAKAQLPVVQKNYERSLKLISKNVIPQAKLDQDQAKLAEVKAAVARIQAMLDQKQIKAPFAGKVGIKLVNVGDFVQPGQDLVSLQDSDPMFINFSVPEKHMDAVEMGQTVQIHSDVFGEKVYQGKVTAKDVFVSTATRSLRVQATIPNPKHELLPGTFVQVSLYTGTPVKTIVVPTTSIVYSTTGNFIYKVVDGVAKKTPINMGQMRGGTVAILAGLKPKDSIVTAGTVKLHDGAPVVAGHD